MLSSKFIQVIEAHSNQIAQGALDCLHRDPRTAHVGDLPEAELRRHCEEILENLGHWLAGSRPDEVASRFEDLGRLRHREGIPLHESVQALLLLKNKMLDYIRDQGLAQTSVDLYAEEELEHQVGCFFDSVVYHVVRGYEGAGLAAAQTSA